MKRQSQMGLVNYSTLIKKYGWTKNMIEKYLPEPVLYTERFYSGDMGYRYMKLYKISDICKAYENPEFLSRLDKSQKRYMEKYFKSFKDIPKEENKDRTNLIENVMNNIGVIYIKQSIIDELSYNYIIEWLKEHPRAKSQIDINDPLTRAKVALKYIIINLTTSEDDYRILNNCHCTEKEFLAYRNALYLKIAKVYPKYTKLCKSICGKSLKYTEKEYDYD